MQLACVDLGVFFELNYWKQSAMRSKHTSKLYVDRLISHMYQAMSLLHDITLYLCIFLDLKA